MKKFKLTCIIDDDTIYVYGFTRLLGRTGFTDKLIIFSNGKYALDFLSSHIDQKEELPDIIFLDVNMPVMDGWEFLNEFARLKPQLGKKIIVYIISSSIADEDFIKAKSISVISDFIVKPVSEERLYKILSDAYAEPANHN